MNGAKYIVVHIHSTESLIIFDDKIEHASFVNMLMINQHDVISAGFVSIYVDIYNQQTARAWGESIGLRVKARQIEDTKLLKTMLFGNNTNKA